VRRRSCDRILQQGEILPLLLVNPEALTGIRIHLRAFPYSYGPGFPQITNKVLASLSETGDP